MFQNIFQATTEVIYFHQIQQNSDVGNLLVMNDEYYFKILSVSPIKHEFMNAISLQSKT